jgi:hypothetical protein
MQQPERPTSQPAVALLESLWHHGVRQHIEQDRTIISSLNNSGNSDGELEVGQVADEDIDGVFQPTTQEEECSGIL